MKADRLLESYCDMDTNMRAEMLAAVDSFIKQGRTVEYRNQTYHHIEDLTVDVEAHCMEVASSERSVEQA